MRAIKETLKGTATRHQLQHSIVSLRRTHSFARGVGAMPCLGLFEIMKRIYVHNLVFSPF